jgi:DNA-binding NarL/FixJ family response regulator
MLKILIADDQILFLDMLCTIVSTYEGFTVAARAANGKEAYEKFLTVKPDICLLDIQMPILNGIETLRRIKEINSSAKVIMLTTFNDEENIVNAYNLDADGYILKDIKPEALINAIKCAASGLVCMNKGVMGMLHKRLAASLPLDNSAHTLDATRKFDQINMEIIRLIGSGYTNKQISEALNYSEGTIRNRISDILFETGLRDRTQIALFALKNGIS